MGGGKYTSYWVWSLRWVVGSTPATTCTDYLFAVAAFLGTTEGLGGSQRRAPRRERRARIRAEWRQLVKLDLKSQMR